MFRVLAEEFENCSNCTKLILRANFDSDRSVRKGEKGGRVFGGCHNHTRLPMTSEVPPPCTLRRSDGKAGHEHWEKSKNKSLLSPTKSLPQYSYSGSCHCQAIEFEFGTSTTLDSETTFYTCECNACFKRGYLFYVVPPKHFRFTSRLASDLGTYATATGITALAQS